MKICSHCKKRKNLSEFPKNKNTKSGIHIWCKECCNEKNRKSYRKHRKKRIKKTSEYHRKMHNIYIKRWAIKHPDIRKYINLKSKCKKKKRILLSREDFLKWYREQEKKCYYCGIPEGYLRSGKWKNGVSGKTLWVDRKNNAKGYLKDNVVLSCPICNQMKGATLSAKEMKEIASKYIKPKWKKLFNGK